MSKMAFSLVVLSFLVRCNVLGATSIEDCTAYLLKPDESVGISSFFDATKWSDEKIPGLGSTNYVASGMTLRDPGKVEEDSGNTIKFPGDVLVLAGTFAGAVGGSAKINWPELRMQNGSKYSWSSFSHLYGLIVIESDEDNPAAFEMFHPGNINTTEFHAKFVGERSTGIILQRRGTPQVAVPDLKWAIRGDWTEFYGTCHVANRSQIYFYNNEHIIPGAFVVQDGGYWWFRNNGTTVTVRELDLQDGSHYWGRYAESGGTVTTPLTIITDKLTLGAVNIDFYSKCDYDTSVKDNVRTRSALRKITSPFDVVEIPLFKLEGIAAQNVPDLTKAVLPEYPEASRLCDFPRSKELFCKDNGDGTKTIYAKYYTADGIIRMKKSNASYDPAGSAFNVTGDSVADYWEPAEVPTSETSGEVYAEKSITWTGYKTYDFPELEFIIAPSAYVYMQCTSLTVKKFTFTGDSSIQSYSQNSAKSLYGPIEICGKDTRLTMTAWQKYHLTLHGDIFGAGNLKFDCSVPHHNPVGYFTLKGSNAGLKGSFSIMTKSNPEAYVGSNGYTNPKFPDLEKGIYLQVGIERGDQFGGAYEGADAWSSIRVNNYACINVTNNDVVVDEPTRGFFVDGGTQLNIGKNHSMTLDIPVTYGGELLKRGEGTLVLGSAARFIDGNVETLPLEGTNVLTVAAGKLKAISSGALNGVAVRLGKGAVLSLDASPADSGLAEYGIVNTKWNTPFASDEDDGSVQVEINGLDSVAQPDAFALPLCTVTSDAAATVRFKIPRVKHFYGETVARENADGTVTLLADYKRRGKIFIKVR